MEEVTRVAIYLDFENLAIEGQKRYPKLPKPLRLDAIMDFAKNHGNICLKRAYADWAKEPCSKYVNDLASYAFELIHLPQLTDRGKNGADLRMTMDAMEDVLNNDLIDKYIIGSGDTDFIHLIRKIQQRGKMAIVIGFEGSVGSAICDNSNECKFIGAIMGEVSPTIKEADEGSDSSTGRDVLLRYIRSRSQSSDEGVLMSALKPDLKRLQPDFDEKLYGFKGFKDFIESFLNDIVTKIEAESPTGKVIVYFKDWAELVSEVDVEKVKYYMDHNLRVQRDPELRKALIGELLATFKAKDSPSINEMTEILYEKMGRKMSKMILKSFVKVYGEGRLFNFADVPFTGIVHTMPMKLNEEVPSIEKLDEIYVDRINDLILRKFPGTPLNFVQSYIGQKGS